MITNIEDVKGSLKKKVAADFYQKKHVVDIAKEYGLSINEVLAILVDKNVDAQTIEMQIKKSVKLSVHI